MLRYTISSDSICKQRFNKLNSSILTWSLGYCLWICVLDGIDFMTKQPTPSRNPFKNDNQRSKMSWRAVFTVACSCIFEFQIFTKATPPLYKHAYTVSDTLFIIYWINIECFPYNYLNTINKYNLSIWRFDALYLWVVSFWVFVLLPSWELTSK